MATKKSNLPASAVAARMEAAERNVRVTKKPAKKSTPAVSGKTKVKKFNPKKGEIKIERTWKLKAGGSK